MKKSLFALVVLFLSLVSACDNGDIDAPTFEFEDQISFCDDYQVLYVTNTDNTEAFILHLSSQDIDAVAATNQISISSDNVNYRVFDEAIASDYFCSAIPPATPRVTKNWTGVEGVENYIQIETIAVTDGGSGFKHHITLHNLILQNADEQSVIYDEFDFGTFTVLN